MGHNGWVHAAGKRRAHSAGIAPIKMIRSMTGFGRSEHKSGSVLVAVEIRCVNHRFAELRVKVPRALAPLEDALRQRMAASIARGRADATVSISGLVGDAPVEVNHELIRAYVAAGAEVAKRHGLPGEITLQAVLSLPGAVSVRGGENGALSKAEERAVEQAFDAALEELAAARAKEGKHLAADVSRRLKQMQKHRAAIAARARNTGTRYSKRLRERLAAIEESPHVDPARLAQEVALLASRSDVTEELVRLDGHIRQAETLLKGGKEPVGKRLDFLVQEMLREANTINSKSEELEISRDALAIKAEIEKTREQIQNIE